MVADDRDRGDNARVEYSLLTDWGTEVFSLHPTTGIFTLTGDLVSITCTNI